MTTKRYNKVPKRKRYSNVVNGVNTCRYCGLEAKAPRKTFCSDKCVHEWKIRSSNSYMREHVYLRDLGICGECGVDTRQTKIIFENWQRELRNLKMTKNEYLSAISAYQVTDKESYKSLWHADHILSVADGGGSSGLDNIRTLCIKCHKTRTKAWIKSR